MKILSVSFVLSLTLVPLSPWRLCAAAATPALSTNVAVPAKPAVSLSDLFPDTTIVKGKGFEIKRSQLDGAATSIKSSAVARGQTISPDQMQRLEQQILERLIQIQLLMSKATDADKAKGQETSTKRFENVKTRAGTEETLNRQLKSVGMSQEELHNKMIEEATAEAVLERELKVNVTEDEVKKFYDDNPARFEQPEMVRVSHILLTTKDQASGAEFTEAQKTAKHKQIEDILKRARAGEDFAKLVKEFSEDPASKDQSGEYTFARGKMMPEFEAAAFSLKTNQVSDVVTTPYGYHIIKLSEQIPAKKVELAKVSQDIKDYLKGQAVQKDLPKYIEQAKKDSDVQILDPKLKPAESAFDSPPTSPPPVATDGKKP